MRQSIQKLLVHIETVKAAPVQSQADCSTMTLPPKRSSALQTSCIAEFDKPAFWAVLVSPPPVDQCTLLHGLRAWLRADDC